MEYRCAHNLAGPARRAQTAVNVREVLNGIFYVLWTGCKWKALPKDLPPKSTVHLELWNWDGTLERIHHAGIVTLLGLSAARCGRKPRS
jgi:transposase